MKNFVINKRELYIVYFTFFIFMCLVFGFGYFFGRYEQILLNKSTLEIIPDVNCGLVE